VVVPSALAVNSFDSPAFNKCPLTNHWKLIADADDAVMAVADNTATKLNNASLALDIYAISFASIHRDIPSQRRATTSRDTGRGKPLIDALITIPALDP
jgi:hypothetical protein